MRPDDIEEVSIDSDHRLLVKPSSASFPMIFRTGMEVHWDAERKCLYGPKPRRWTYAQWFQQILAAALDEYGTTLKLSPATRWVDVPPDIRETIENL